ncbi:MAG: hypothetical protein HRU09_07060 [Oligoflexales bacterium]|nr:hypothetical protein [Oligoflexales bacterium]
MVTSSDWHSQTTFKDREQTTQHDKTECRRRNSLILQQFVESCLAQHGNDVDGNKAPYLIFEKLKNCHSVLKQIKLEAYPASNRSYQKYVLYNHVESDLPPFSFTLIVFAPKQKTPKHSHRVDCAPLCLQGLVKETLYREVEQENSSPQKLEVVRTKIYKPYEGAYLLKCQPNIHHLENASDGISMSLHLYLFDACCPSGKSSSILKVYR